MLRRITAGLAALTLSAGLALAPSTPAHAAASDCSAYVNVVCFHQYTNYTGLVWRQTVAQVASRCVNLTDWPGWNDRPSTAFNTSTGGYQLYLYENINCTGYDFILASGQNVSFTGSLAWWNDKVTSLYLYAL